MSYEVLARKWRPLVFDDVVGQDHITRTLKKAVESDRISHAYLFAGPRGCGKTSTARILARVINCTNLKKGNPCNKCASCTGVIAGNNLDVMEIDGASHTGVSEVRDLQGSIGYTPSQFKNKVYIIDEVHMLSTHAFNALLKTLEEPPAHVYFIFATTAPQKIPDTIKSRCQRHHFKRLEIREIAGQLEAICKAEKVKYDEEALRLLARKADGSMRDGTSLLDQCITSSSGKVTGEAVREILGLIDQERVFGFMKSVSSGEPGDSIRLLDQCMAEGLDINELCAALLEGYRDLMLLATPGDLSDLLFRSKDEITLLEGMLDGYELSDLVTVVERLCDTIPRLKNAADPRILLESTLVELSLLERQVDIRQVIEKLENPGSGGEVGAGAKAKRPSKGKEARADSAAPVVTERREADPGQRPAPPVMPPVMPAETVVEVPAPAAAATVAAAGTARPKLDLETLAPLWGGFVTFVRQKKVALGVCLISGKLHAFDGDRVTLRFMKNFSLQKEQVSDPRNAEFLKSMLKKYFGREMELVCFTDGEPVAPASKQPARAEQRAERRLAGVSEEKKPVVRKIMEEFDGEIIRYSP